MHVSPFQRGHYERVRLKIMLTWSAKKWTLHFSASFQMFWNVPLWALLSSSFLSLLTHTQPLHHRKGKFLLPLAAAEGPWMLQQFHLKMKSRCIFFSPHFFPLCHWENQAPRCNGCRYLAGSTSLLLQFPSLVNLGEFAGNLNFFAGALSLKSKCYWIFKTIFFYQIVNRFGTIFVKNCGRVHAGIHPWNCVYLHLLLLVSCMDCGTHDMVLPQGASFWTAFL